jgi:hypothetical protein
MAVQRPKESVSEHSFVLTNQYLQEQQQTACAGTGNHGGNLEVGGWKCLDCGM